MADQRDKMKLLLAIVGIVAAGGILAWYFGLFSPAPAKPADAAAGVQKDATGAPKGGGAKTPPGAKPPQ